MKSKILILFVAMGLSGTANMVCGQTTAVPDTLSKYILTPKAPDTPRINGAKVFGVRPGSHFLYTIPATGVRPMSFAVDHSVLQKRWWKRIDQSRLAIHQH